MPEENKELAIEKWNEYFGKIHQWHQEAVQGKGTHDYGRDCQHSI